MSKSNNRRPLTNAAIGLGKKNNEQPNNEVVKDIPTVPVVTPSETVPNEIPNVQTIAKVKAKDLDFGFLNAGNLNEKASKKTMRETHKHVTFLVEKELADKLDKLINAVAKAKGVEKGGKTAFMNDIIKDVIEQAEKQGFKF